jgi:competence ComEA-like helix-hairpin-helix protein
VLHTHRRRLTPFLAFSLFFGLFIGFSQHAVAAEVLKGKTVNINKATAAEIATVPLITPDLAKKIVDYRKENGDFQVLEELLQVPGFNRVLLDRIKPFLLLEGLGGDECTC